MYLELTNLTKTYKEKNAVKNISFNLEKGKLLCLLGPSGCGKSTVLKSIGGFLKPDSGKIILDGKEITNDPPENRNVSTVFQSYGLFPHMNVLSNIIYGLKFKKMPKAERVEAGMKMIKTMGLSGYEKKHISELSGGEQQRVALARSLIIRPKLLLLDEPLSNLDAKLRINMRKEIKQIQKEFNITTIFVTHDQSEAFEIADKIILMSNGEIIQEGTAESLYNQPANEFALDFIGANNKIENSYIRPEKIKVFKSLPEEDTEDFEEAQIINIIFKGEIIELFLKTKEKELKAIVLNNDFNYQKNEKVYIKYNRENLN